MNTYEKCIAYMGIKSKYIMKPLQFLKQNVVTTRDLYAPHTELLSFQNLNKLQKYNLKINKNKSHKNVLVLLKNEIYYS